MADNVGGKTVLIGLDGATYSILDPLISQGLMPNLDGLMSRGSRAILASTAHPLTPPAWTALMTGRTPGVHGIYDFIRVDPTGKAPSYTLANSADVRAETIWSIASRYGRRVTTLNFPLMFPAPDINGFVIPGYVPWSYLGRAIKPRDLYKRMRDKGLFNAREMSTDWEHERKAVQGLAEDELDGWVNFHIVRERHWFQILLMLMREEPCDLTAVLFDGVDRIQHLCYHLLDPSSRAEFSSPKAEATRKLCFQYFSELDGFIGEILALAGPEAHIVVASDHGFCRAGDKIFYVNTWLEKNGYLTWADGVAPDDSGRLGLNQNDELGRLFDWTKTAAFAFSSSSNGIYIRKAEEPGGPGVQPHDYPALRDEMRARLLDYKDPQTGERVVRDVLLAEEAFPGMSSDKAPDLTLKLWDFGFQSVLRARSPMEPRRTPYGTHHPDGVFMTAGPGVSSGKPAGRLSICDVAATVLYHLGIPIPEDMEGKVPVAAMTPAHLQSHPVEFGPPALSGEAIAGEQLPEAAEAEIRERLKALGYI